MDHKFTKVENEIIILKIVNDTIDSMINHSLLELRGEENAMEVYFHSSIHQEMFNIILVDFLSIFDIELSRKKQTCLELLGDICTESCFNIKNSIGLLKDSVEVLKAWLDNEIEFDVYFQKLEKTLLFKIKRIEFLRICGNISKHNLGRLTKQASLIRKIFERNNIDITELERLIIMEAIYVKCLIILNGEFINICYLNLIVQTK